MTKTKQSKAQRKETLQANIDKVRAALSAKVLAGDPKAIAQWLHINEQEMKLLGLAMSAEKPEPEPAEARPHTIHMYGEPCPKCGTAGDIRTEPHMLTDLKCHTCGYDGPAYISDFYIQKRKVLDCLEPEDRKRIMHAYRMKED